MENYSQNTEMVEFLIEEGADPAQKNSAGKTAKDVAQKKNKKSFPISVVRISCKGLPP